MDNRKKNKCNGKTTYFNNRNEPKGLPTIEKNNK